MMRCVLLMSCIFLCGFCLADSVVVFNEVMYHPADDADATLEWVELYNQMSVDVDIAGWSVKGFGYTFPTGTIIPARSYRVVAVSPTALQAATGYATAFGPTTGQLSNSGEALELTRPDGRVMDRLDYEDAGDWPVAADGSGATLAKIDRDMGSAHIDSWTFSAQTGGTPGTENFPGGLNRPVTLALNEIDSSLESVFNIELVNHSGSTLNLNGYVLTTSNPLNGDYVFSSETLPDGGYKVLNSSMLGWTAPMAEGDRLFLHTPGNTSVIDGAVVKNRLRGRFPEATGDWAYPDAATFGAANVFSFHDEIVINEIMYHAFPIQETPSTPGTYQTTTLLPIDAIWRYNQTGNDLGTDWHLTEHPVDNQNWFQGQALLGLESSGTPEPIRTPLTVSSSQIIYYFETEFDFTGNPADVVNLQLQHIIDDGAIFYLNGVEFYRFNMPEGNLYASPGVGNAVYSAAITFPVGSLVSGSNRLSVEVHQSSTVSSDVVFGAKLSIFEQLTPTISGEPYAESDEEWIELYNQSGHAVSLDGWKLDDGISYEFPTGTTLAAGDYLVVAKDAATLGAKYPSVNIIGDFSGRLSDSGERIVLKDQNGNLADRISYLDRRPWPQYSDGDGASLERICPDSDGTLATNFSASDESAKSDWKTYTYRGIAVEDGIGLNNWHELCLGLLDAGEIWLDDISVIEDPDGAAIELIQNGSFQSDAIGSTPAAWRLVGNHGLHGRSVIEADPDNPSNRVLRLVATGYTRHEFNLAETTFTDGRQVSAGKEYQISYRARWIAGSNRLNSRLYFNWLQKTTLLDVPQNTGTPGQQNSCYQPTTQPQLYDLTHSPVVPNTGQSTTVSVKAVRPDRISQMRLYYSVNGGSWSYTVMSYSGADEYTGLIPAQSYNAKVQFYVRCQDNDSELTMLPAAGADSRAMYTVTNTASTAQRHSLRIIMTDADWNTMGEPSNSPNKMSNYRFGCTVIYDERQTYYDVGVRFRGSASSRTSTTAGYNIEFPADNLFRGVHRSVSIERQNDIRELVTYQMLNSAGGGLANMYCDVATLYAPYGGTGLLMMAHYTDVFFESAYKNGGEGTLYNYDLLYQSTGTVDGSSASYPESLKIFRGAHTYTIQNLSPEFTDYGDDKETYRWMQQNKNNRRKDDYDLLIQMNKALGLTGQELEDAANATMDVSQWARTFGMEALMGNDDFYGRLYWHNLKLYQRPEDNKMIALPWDMDRAFRLATNSPLWTANNLGNLFDRPANQRLFYGHLRDMIETTCNSSYMSYWTSHLGSVAGYNYSSYLSYIQNRANYAVSQFPNQYSFAVTDPNLVVADAFATIHGTAWIDMKELYLDGIDEPLELDWTMSGSGTSKQFFFTATVPVEPGVNNLTFHAYDFQNRLIATHTMTVTSTVAERPLRDYLRVTEIMYDPVGGSDEEFIELQNTSGQTLDLTHVTFVDGITFNFGASSVSSLVAGEYVLVVKDLAAFSSRYNTAGLNIAGEFSGKLSNDGETVTLQGQWASKILSLTYADSRGWPLAADGAGHSLVPIYAAIESQADGSADFGPNWRASTYLGGSPGTADPQSPDSVVINEVCAHTDFSSPSYPDHDSNDWIELYNPSGATVTFNSDWYLSDDKNDLKKWSIGSNSIAVGQWLSFDEISDFHNPITAGFGLDKAGEQVYLSYLPGSENDRVVDCLKFKGQPNGSSLSRVPDGGEFWCETALTRDTTNAGANSVCVISEFMYHPAAGGKEYIELKNLTASSLTLWDNAPDVNRGWRLDGGVSFDFTESTTIPADGFLLLVGFDPNEMNLAAFNSFYGTTLTADQVVGPYSGDLSNNTERIALERPQASDDPLNPNDLSWIIVDEAIYFDQVPWPYNTDGTGQSVQRKELENAGNNPQNWQGQMPNPTWWVSQGDFSGDGTIGLEDIEIFAQAWLSETSDTNWNADCDIATPADGTIDLQDYVEFAEFWQ